MSDPGRKSFQTKIKEKVTPGIFKSKARKAKEKTSDHADTVARETQPDSTKGAAQSAADKFGRAKGKIVHGTTVPKPKSRNPFSRKRV